MNALQTLTIVMEIALTMLVVTHATVRSERSWIQMELLALVNEQNTSKSSYTNGFLYNRHKRMC